jgi:hypothetical protein
MTKRCRECRRRCEPAELVRNNRCGHLSLCKLCYNDTRRISRKAAKKSPEQLVRRNERKRARYLLLVNGGMLPCDARRSA